MLEPAIAMMGWIFASRASFIAKLPRADEAPYMTNGREYDADWGFQGLEVPDGEKEIAAVVVCCRSYFVH